MTVDCCLRNQVAISTADAMVYVVCLLGKVNWIQGTVHGYCSGKCAIFNIYQEGESEVACIQMDENSGLGPVPGLCQFPSSVQIQSMGIRTVGHFTKQRICSLDR